MINISKMQKDWDLRAQKPILNIVGKDIPEDVFWKSGEIIAEGIYKTFQLSSFSVILDYGCGIGRISIPLSRQDSSLEVFGVDVSNEMLVLARKNNKSKKADCRFYKIREGGKIPFESYSFDLIYEVLTIQHIPYVYLDYIFGEWARLLKQHGRLCIRPFTVRDDVSEASKAIPEENTWRSRTYSKKDFDLLLNKYGIFYENDVIIGNRKQSVWIKKG